MVSCEARSLRPLRCLLAHGLAWGCLSVIRSVRTGFPSSEGSSSAGLSARHKHGEQAATERRQELGLGKGRNESGQLTLPAQCRGEVVRGNGWQPDASAAFRAVPFRQT